MKLFSKSPFPTLQFRRKNSLLTYFHVDRRVFDKSNRLNPEQIKVMNKAGYKVNNSTTEREALVLLKTRK